MRVSDGLYELVAELSGGEGGASLPALSTPSEGRV